MYISDLRTDILSRLWSWIAVELSHRFHSPHSKPQPGHLIPQLDSREVKNHSRLRHYEHRFFFFSVSCFTIADQEAVSRSPALFLRIKVLALQKRPLLVLFPLAGRAPAFLDVAILLLLPQKFSDSAVILAIAVFKRCPPDFVYWIFGYCTIRPFRNNVFKEYFFSAFVDFGVPFSINFHSSSAFLGFLKALEQDAMSSSDSAVRLFRMLIFNVHKSVIVINSIT